jgi:hypothetical protein
VAGGIEHHHNAFFLWLVLSDPCAQRHRLVDHLEEALASIGPIAQVVNRDVQVHAHLLVAGDGRPHRWDERLLALELELLLAGR